MSRSFVNDLGRNYAHENLSGAVFMHEGVAYSLEDISEDCDEFSATNLTTGRSKTFDVDMITGWKMFKYPKLGYRSLNKDVAVWCSRGQSYARGLNANNLRTAFSNFTYTFSESTGQYNNFSWRDKMRAILMPVFHTKEDVKRLFSGEIPHVVLNEDVLIELPSSPGEAEVWEVYFRSNLLGSIDASLNITAADAANRKIIERIVNKYVA